MRKFTSKNENVSLRFQTNPDLFSVGKLLTHPNKSYTNSHTLYPILIGERVPFKLVLIGQTKPDLLARSLCPN